MLTLLSMVHSAAPKKAKPLKSAWLFLCLKKLLNLFFCDLHHVNLFFLAGLKSLSYIHCAYVAWALFFWMAAALIQRVGAGHGVFKC